MGGFFNKDYNFNINNVFFTTKDAQIFLKISFFSNIFTFSSVIRKHFEHNLRIFANFRVKTQKSMVSPISKPTVLGGDFLIKIILFTLKIYFLQRKTPKVSQKSGS